MLDWNKLLGEQSEIEEGALSQGMKRYHKRVQRAEEARRGSQEGAKRSLLQHATARTAEALQEWLDEAKPGRPHQAKRWVELLGADVAAYMIVKVVIDSLNNEPSVRRVCHSVSTLITDELKWRRLKEEAPGLFKYKMQRFNTRSYAHMARSLHHALNQITDIDVSDLDISPRQALPIGGKLLEALVFSTGIVNIVTRKVQGKGHKVTTEQFVVAEEDTKLWLMERNRFLEVLSPVALPMVVPPLAWSPAQRGGYRFALRDKYAFVRGVTRDSEREIRRSGIPKVFDALNRIQETPWKINPFVHSVLNEAIEAGGGMAGLPSFDEESLPAQPVDIEINEEARTEWRRRASAVHTRNYERRLKTISFAKTMSVVRQVQTREAFWFPYNLDFRGRVYPICAYLSPQGSDLEKGLLRFAQGKRIGKDGSRWLAIHLANTLGETPGGRKVSQMTLDEREAWVEEHTDDVLLVAEDPWATKLWQDADNPWQFLAACYEWQGYIEHGEDFVSSLPVAMDGTCNGLQHFAGLFRDQEAAWAVNVMPNDAPRDVYLDVAEDVKDRLEKLVSEGDEIALMWLSSGLVDRKLAKRPTMTFGYGSERYGFREQILEHLNGLGLDLHEVFRDKIGEAATMMAGIIWDSIKQVVPSAYVGMQWMQGCAREIVRETGEPVAWTAPITGFPVRQDTTMYFKATRHRVTTVLAGEVWMPSVYTATAEVNPHRQANGISPNTIHSLDAAALMLTVLDASTEGVDHFAMIHDSYGTHAADAAVLARVARQAFVKLYQTHDVVEHLEACWARQTPNIPEPPEQGDFDLNQVLTSKYFFS